MAAAVTDFNSWLGRKLQDLNTDENVFGSYIIGILEGDESREEKIDALEGILSEINDSNLSSVCTEIIDTWSRSKEQKALISEAKKEDVDVKLSKMLEGHCLQAPKQKQYTAEEKKIREAILSQYSQMTDDEDEDEGENVTVKETSLVKNTNALAVQMAEKEKREQAKKESQIKKERDKEDREKQKQAKEEKKEKRKTQKGERKR